MKRIRQLWGKENTLEPLPDATTHDGSRATGNQVVTAKPARTTPESNPVELGRVEWIRELNLGYAESPLGEAKRQKKPVFLFFQEVPGCGTCQRFGIGVLSQPAIVEALRYVSHLRSANQAYDAHWTLVQTVSPSRVRMSCLQEGFRSGVRIQQQRRSRREDAQGILRALVEQSRCSLRGWHRV
eukprot:scaffold1504_cov417-Prasinococcus_capsulatus_cf.AAC.15